ncbi:MAG: endolytic transglycosylase MltG [Eubacterium sp.]|nr:endolytic transglycosylase MltG [Candidatus Colimonas fimequi]
MKKIIVILAVLILIVGAGGGYYISGLGPVDPDNDELVAVTIPQGSGASSIVHILDEQGLVKNLNCAKVNARIGRYNGLQANTYMFSPSMSFTEMMRAINTGDFNYVSKEKFTIIEGATVPQAAESMAKDLNLSSDEIMAKWNDRAYLNELIDKYWFLTDAILQDGIMFPLEGYLYPETYFVSGDDITIEDATASILDKTDSVLTELQPQIEASGMTIHQFLALASVVENESLFEKDRPTIAGVFMNRLNKGMMLQSDITVLYAHQKKTVAVSKADLEIDSKYNTYKYTGVPIGPVCNPSQGTMEDTLNYEKTDYIYFFAKEDGTVIYSKTLDEHIKAIQENKWY